MQVFKATTRALATSITGDPEMGSTVRLRIVHGVGDDRVERIQGGFAPADAAAVAKKMTYRPPGN
jgi:hypothetical protein